MLPLSQSSSRVFSLISSPGEAKEVCCKLSVDVYKAELRVFEGAMELFPISSSIFIILCRRSVATEDNDKKSVALFGIASSSNPHNNFSFGSICLSPDMARTAFTYSSTVPSIHVC